MSEKKTKGLLLVLTGNGKGKTTSALGLAFRALGHGHKVSMIQFLKGSWKYGEMESAKSFSHLLDFHVMGRGFTWKSDDIEKDIVVACEAWEFAKKTIQDNKHHLVILDELTYLINYKMIAEQEIIDTLLARPEAMHVVVTGRGASENLIRAADLVTEMQEIKHPYKNGIKAQKGIEF
ncbi:MAG: cob(I)yrinic acid a,c-diamide adenosyltransferase [Desulfobulbaceae bacterium]|nr:cob(I)yrinic acid a,c-diamide adenosyltransferase [Desulfobulbaceae bacterium]